MTHPDDAAQLPPTSVDVEATLREKNGRAVAWAWILNGGLWLALIVYVLTMWVVSGDFETNTIGRGQEPTWFVVLVRVVEVLFGVVFTGFLLWHFVIRPKIRTKRFTFTGLYFMAGFLMFVQEPWLNWTSYQFLYSTTFVNFGSFLRWVPGWSSPNGKLIPFPLVYMAAYIWMSAFAGYLGSRYMARRRAKDPTIGTARMIGQTLLWMLLFDFILEFVMVRTQLISFASTIKELTLWAGTDHQWPLYEPFHWAGTWLLLACIHFFRDDRGRSLPERHIDKLPIRREGTRTFLRFLAIMGACQLTILVAFNLPYQLWALHSGPMPKEFIERPWRIAGVCGPGTKYACPDPELPIARRGASTNRTR